MRQNVVSTCLVLVLLLLQIQFAQGQFGSPELSVLPQLGCKTGLTLPPISGATGQFLSGTVYDLSDFGFATDTIPADAEPGIYPLRAIGPNGISNSRNVLVTAEPWTVVSGNESEVNPAAIAAGTVWQDECPERGRNYYRIKVDRDQKLELQSFAHALDSRARLVLTLLNADHATVASCSATNDFDANLILDLKADLDYLLVVHDHLFRGGAEYRYALKLIASPVAPLPLLDRWKLISKQLRYPINQPLTPSIAWHPRCSMLRAPSEATVVVHDESAYPDKKPMHVSWPAIVSGEWNTNDDVDNIDFECDAKTDVSIEIVSQRLGELTDGIVVVHRIENPGQANEVLHRIAENDDAAAVGNGEIRFTIKDSMITFQASEKGTYRLQVRNQQRLDKGSALPQYAIEIRKPNPGFALACGFAHPILLAEQARMTPPTLCAGGAVMLAAHVLRFDNFNEPIELSVSGLPSGVRGGSGVIGKDQNIAILNLWNYGPPTNPQERQQAERLTLTGSVEIGQQSISVQAVSVEVTWNLIDTFRSPIAKIVQSLPLAKLETTVCPLTIELGPKDVDAKFPIRMDVVRGQALKIPVRVTRRAGGEGLITMRLHHGPPKATLAEVKIEAKASEGVLELQVPKDAPIGEYLIGVLCESPVTVPNPDPAAKEKTKSITLQLPSSNLRVRIGDAP